MRKFLLLLALFTATFGFSQERDISEVTFYGIDFSLVKVYRANESGVQFKSAFDGINKLFISEPRKYNVAKALNVYIRETNLDAVNAINKNIDADKLHTDDKKYKISETDLQNAIKKLPNKSDSGIGVVFVAEMLNKSSGLGYYKIVYFDEKSKDIIKISESKGKVGGSGLRNFWAGSVSKMLKDKKIRN